MSESNKKILEMLAQGKISVDDAQRLMSAISADEKGTGNGGHDNTGHEPGRESLWGKVKGKYLRVTVTPPEGVPDFEGHPHQGEEGDLAGHFHHGEGPQRVNVRIPMSLIRAGVKLTALIPPDALDKANEALRDKGINFDVRNIKQADLEELIDALGDMQIDIDGSHGEKVKVFVE
jgi:hypothetical protein